MTNMLEEINQNKEMQNVENRQNVPNEHDKTINHQEKEGKELVTKEEQNGFLNSTIGKVINTAIDLGLRWALPDFIENQIIDVKNSLIKGGLKEGIDKAVESAVEIGKTVTNIFTGKFDSISQAQNAIKNGGIIDSVSDVLDSALAVTSKNGWLSKSTTNLIKKGKNVILDNVSSNIETEFVSQLSSIEKLAKYENNWKKYYQAQNFEGMEKEYDKIKEKLKEIMPLEQTIKQARQIENIHMLIKNNGQNFNLTNEQLQLAGVL